jgi:ribulose bisphosphate carboxylase small subunit
MNKEIESLKKSVDKLLHRVVALEEEKKGNRYFDVEYNNHPDPDHWSSWGISSIHFEDVGRILESVNQRSIDNDNKYFKTIKHFRIVEKNRGINKVIKIIENKYCSLSWQEYLKESKPKRKQKESHNETMA